MKKNYFIVTSSAQTLEAIDFRKNQINADEKEVVIL
jgi:hypothetical protein